MYYRYTRTYNKFIAVLPLPIYMNTQMMSNSVGAPRTSTSGAPRTSTSGAPRTASVSGMEAIYARYSAPNTPRDKSFTNLGNCFINWVNIDLGYFPGEGKLFFCRKKLQQDVRSARKFFSSLPPPFLRKNSSPLPWSLKSWWGGWTSAGKNKKIKENKV